jgi:hypothetical protein
MTAGGLVMYKFLPAPVIGLCCMPQFQEYCMHCPLSGMRYAAIKVRFFTNTVAGYGLHFIAGGQKITVTAEALYAF